MAASNFSENVRRLRTRNGLTVASAAGVAGVSVPTWYKYEQGTQSPSFLVIDAIAAALKVHPQALFSDLKPEKKRVN